MKDVFSNNEPQEKKRKKVTEAEKEELSNDVFFNYQCNLFSDVQNKKGNPYDEYKFFLQIYMSYYLQDTNKETYTIEKFWNDNFGDWSELVSDL